MAKRKKTCCLSMKAGQDRTQVSDQNKAVAKADLVLNIRAGAFPTKADLVRAIDVLRNKADNMDWPPGSSKKARAGEPGGYATERAASAVPERDPTEPDPAEDEE